MSNTEHAARGARRPTLMASNGNAESMAPESSRVLADLGGRAASRRNRIVVAVLGSLAAIGAGGVFYWAAAGSPTTTLAGSHAVAVDAVPSPHGAAVVAIAETSPASATDAAPTATMADGPAPTIATVASGTTLATPSAQSQTSVAAERSPTDAAPVRKASREASKAARPTATKTSSEKTHAKRDKTESTVAAKTGNRAKSRTKPKTDLRKRVEPDPDTDLLAAILRRSGDGMTAANSSAAASGSRVPRQMQIQMP